MSSRGVVDDVVGAERADQLDVVRAAHAGHGGAEVLGELDGESADSAGRSDDQHLVPRLDLAVVPQGLQGGRCRERHGGGVLERDGPRSVGEESFGDGDSLGEGAEAGHERRPVDLVAGLHRGDVRTDSSHDAGEVASGDLEARSPETDLEPGDVGDAADEVPVGGVDGGGVDLDEDLVVLEAWFVDVGG